MQKFKSFGLVLATTLFSMSAFADPTCLTYTANKGVNLVSQICFERSEGKYPGTANFNEPTLNTPNAAKTSWRIAAGITPSFRARKICSAINGGEATAYSIGTCPETMNMSGEISSDAGDPFQALNCFESVTCGINATH